LLLPFSVVTTIGICAQWAYWTPAKRTVE